MGLCGHQRQNQRTAGRKSRPHHRRDGCSKCVRFGTWKEKSLSLSFHFISAQQVANRLDAGVSQHSQREEDSSSGTDY